MIHIVSSEAMERMTGLATPQGGPVQVKERERFKELKAPDEPALCGITHWAMNLALDDVASVRAVREEPSRFENERMCPRCTRVAASMFARGQGYQWTMSAGCAK